MAKKGTIEEKVYDGIRKTINRFREKPFHYFTEADIHASLLNDIKGGGSNTVVIRHKNTSISLVHQEYPTNFRYRKDNLVSGYLENEEITSLDPVKGVEPHSDRGNYDLAILNPAFVKSVFAYSDEKEICIDQVDALDHIINKDNKKAISRKKLKDFSKELLFAIEVKFLHSANARHKVMIEEVIKDNEKLRLAHYHSNGFVKPINLVFCSTIAQKRRDNKKPVVNKIKELVKNGSVENYSDSDLKYYLNKNKKGERDKVLTIFIESYLSTDGPKKRNKITSKPISNKERINERWVSDFVDLLKI